MSIAPSVVPFEVEVAFAQLSGVTVSVRGELDIVTAPRLEQCLKELASMGMRNVTVDLEGVEFIGSAGLAILINAHDRAEIQGDTLALASPSRQVRRLFQVTHMGDNFHFLVGPGRLSGRLALASAA